ncbi:MAG: hypothetical protein ACRD0K_01585 [Egibacteraceae bacterium]
MRDRFMFSDARREFSSVYDRVAGDGAAVIVERRGSGAVAVVPLDQLRADLAALYPFSHEVLFDENGPVSVWLPEFAVYGQGNDLDHAIDDLIDEVEDYVEEWFEGLRHAPNHAGRLGWVRRVGLTAGRVETSFAVCCVRLLTRPLPTRLATFSLISSR